MSDPRSEIDALPERGPSVAGDAVVLVTVSSEIHIKSSRTRARFLRKLASNLASKLARRAPAARVLRTWDRILIEGEDLERAAAAAAETFGVQKALFVRPLAFRSLDDLTQRVAEAARPAVAGRTFAVRVKRRGTHAWRSIDAERLIGAALLPSSAGVNLTEPEAVVRLHVLEDQAFLEEKVFPGPDGLPLGVQGRTLTLLSGGFDSAVAAWMIMRRGAGTDFLHFLMDCAQSEHAMAVAYELFDRWGDGSESLIHVIDFQPVKDLLQQRVHSRLRQVVLKQLMVATADLVAARHHIPVLVTGDSVGQVSSQTLEHLAAIDRHCTRSILRPLSGLTKQEIIQWSRVVGTHDLSARAKEVCDLSDGPVATAAKRRELDEAYRTLPEGLPRKALEGWRVLSVRDWGPGEDLVPVVPRPPDGVPLINTANDAPDVPAGGPVALSGRRAAHAASDLHRRGRDVVVVS